MAQRQGAIKNERRQVRHPIEQHSHSHNTSRLRYFVAQVCFGKRRATSRRDSAALCRGKARRINRRGAQSAIRSIVAVQTRGFANPRKPACRQSHAPCQTSPRQSSSLPTKPFPQAAADNLSQPQGLTNPCFDDRPTPSNNSSSTGRRHETCKIRGSLACWSI
jgi:hypothetical protein